VWCLTNEESRQWCEGRGITLAAPHMPSLDGAKHKVVVPLNGKEWSQLTWVSAFTAESLKPFDVCLLWVTQWGVWPSSENLHLFYRLRETYGERRLLHDAPGHLFLDYEAADLTTFIELVLIFGWDAYLLPRPGYANAFISHDGFLDFYTDDESSANTVRDALEGKPPERTR
jgi:hypothetical protein